MKLLETNSDFKEACLDAIKLWGQPEQLVQAMGECGEFIAEVGRHFQGRDPELNNVAEEAADVIILMMQVRELVGASKFDYVLETKFKKFVNKLDSVKVKY